MAAFTHLNPQGSRFSDGSYGVFYAGKERATAIAETRYHHGRFLAATGEGSMHLPMRLYHVDIDAKLHDLRLDGVGRRGSTIRDSYHRLAAGRRAPCAPRAPMASSIAAPGIRGGQCAGLFKPKAARNCVHAAYLLYAWDGMRFSGVYEQTD